MLQAVACTVGTESHLEVFSSHSSTGPDKKRTALGVRPVRDEMDVSK